MDHSRGLTHSPARKFLPRESLSPNATGTGTGQDRREEQEWTPTTATTTTRVRRWDRRPHRNMPVERQTAGSSPSS